MTAPLKFRSDHHCRIRRNLGSLDQRKGEHRSSNEKEERVKVTTIISHWRERSMDNRHCREPNCMGDNSLRKSCNPNHDFTEGLHVNAKRIAERKEGYSNPSMHAPTN
jgi:hypothetical protein